MADRRPVDLSTIAPWLSIVAAILAAGMWLGNLAQRVSSLEANQSFLHGDITAERKGEQRK